MATSLPEIDLVTFSFIRLGPAPLFILKSAVTQNVEEDTQIINLRNLPPPPVKTNSPESKPSQERSDVVELTMTSTSSFEISPMYSEIFFHRM